MLHDLYLAMFSSLQYPEYFIIMIYDYIYYLLCLCIALPAKKKKPFENDNIWKLMFNSKYHCIVTWMKYCIETVSVFW